MNDSIIAEGTIITHTAYPDRLYRHEALEVVGLNSERTYRIMREGASISTGTVAELTAAGFRFNAPEVTVEEIEALLTPEEPTPSAMRQAWLACEEANRDLTTQVATLTVDVTERNITIGELNGKVSAGERALTEFKERVRNEVEAAKNSHDLCIDGCNSFLEELGLPLLTRTWKVTVTRDHDGETLLTVTGVEADDDDAAADAVKENFTVTATVKRVAFDYEYDGEGDADWDCEDWDDDDYDATDDEYAESHKDGGLSFTAEEE